MLSQTEKDELLQLDPAVVRELLKLAKEKAAEPKPGAYASVTPLYAAPPDTVLRSALHLVGYVCDTGLSRLECRSYTSMRRAVVGPFTIPLYQLKEDQIVNTPEPKA